MSLEENIKKWVVIDNQHKKLNEQIKDVREIKNNLTHNIIEKFADKNLKSPVIKLSLIRLAKRRISPSLRITLPSANASL